MAKALNMFLPITKVDAVKREVWGILVEEAVDKSGEIFDYETSKPLFLAWNSAFDKATNGQSVGNLRSMHTNIAAGKFISMDYDDDAKVVSVGAKIVDDNEWKKVEEGVYTGFSIGGKYVNRWYDKAAKATRYTAEPAEGSLVDNPCMYGATFKLIKGEGMEELIKFNGGGACEMNGDMTLLIEGLKKATAEGDLAKAFSFDEIRNRVRAAVNENAYTPYRLFDQWAWIVAIYDNAVVVQIDDMSGRLFSVPYTIDEKGEVTLGTPTEVKQEFVPVPGEAESGRGGLGRARRRPRPAD